ncbi:MAG: acetyl-CoA carboxylase carboxyltransferase subunit beta [Thermomicrobiales bacterium]|nr:acetyl-CoA carboxylase carboxyltransferase subunit beta [Thermomicrobiales bacterium]
MQADDERPDLRDFGDLWVKCPSCNELIYAKELQHNDRVCPKCGHHFRLRARERIALLTDEGSFEEWDAGIRPQDPLSFADGSGPYDRKLTSTQQKSGETEALISGRATIDGRPLALTVTDFDFLGASMGSVFGEKLARAAERCAELGIPLLTVNSSGGARMHEGIFSLMQMAKTIAALSRLGRARVPHIALLTDPTYGGVTASFATVADVIMAEPGAHIGFAGPRVIEQITKQKLPDGFQTAQFLIEHGMIDLIVERSLLRSSIVKLIDHYSRAAISRLAETTAPERINGVISENGARPGGPSSGAIVAETSFEAEP